MIPALLASAATLLRRTAHKVSKVLVEMAVLILPLKNRSFAVLACFGILLYLAFNRLICTADAVKVVVAMYFTWLQVHARLIN